MQTGKFCYFSFDFFLCNFFLILAVFVSVVLDLLLLLMLTDAVAVIDAVVFVTVVILVVVVIVVVADMSLFIIEREIFLSIKDRVFKTNYGKILSEFESQLTGSGT